MENNEANNTQTTETKKVKKSTTFIPRKEDGKIDTKRICERAACFGLGMATLLGGSMFACWISGRNKSNNTPAVTDGNQGT